MLNNYRVGQPEGQDTANHRQQNQPLYQYPGQAVAHPFEGHHESAVLQSQQFQAHLQPFTTEHQAIANNPADYLSAQHHQDAFSLHQQQQQQHHASMMAVHHQYHHANYPSHPLFPGTPLYGAEMQHDLRFQHHMLTSEFGPMAPVHHGQHLPQGPTYQQFPSPGDGNIHPSSGSSPNPLIPGDQLKNKHLGKNVVKNECSE